MLVSVKTDVIIKDACILFDLIDLELLASFYRLNLTVITTPQVLAEITEEQQLTEIDAYAKSGKLQIDDSGMFEIISAIVDNNPGLSFTDASVLEAATRREAMILSSDKSLRNESQRRGIAVKGLLWILEELYLQNIIALNTVLEKLLVYPEINKRAPRSEIEKIVKKYTE